MHNRIGRNLGAEEFERDPKLCRTMSRMGDMIIVWQFAANIMSQRTSRMLASIRLQGRIDH